MGEARGFKLVGRELDLDIVGGIGTDPGRVSALDVEMRLAANPRVEKIYVNLNSPGGDVLQAQRIYNALRSHGAFVEVTVEKQCASAANQILSGRRGSARKSCCIQPKSRRRRARD
jgi:ATP-dependent protease ClpP protease subunit